MTNFMDAQFAAEDALVELIRLRLAHHREVDAAATGQRGPVPVAETLVVGNAAIELSQGHNQMVVANAAGMIGETLALVMMDATDLDHEQVIARLVASLTDYRQRSDAWYRLGQVGPDREQLSPDDARDDEDPMPGGA